MIIDSHAHYAHPRFAGEPPVLWTEDGQWSVRSMEREALFDAMKAQGLLGAIEPSIGIEQLEAQMALVDAHPGFLWAAVGAHPTRCIHTPWEARKTLPAYLEKTNVVAVGETGLDYHYPRREQHRWRQKRWFRYQLRLAEQYGLPVVLHVRLAHRDALRILKHFRGRIVGGVAHCFTGDARQAEDYIALGFAIGIGGALLHDDPRGQLLQDAVRQIPLKSILVETDAPFVLPAVEDLSCSRKTRRKLCNSSDILPKVIERIAELKGESTARVEQVIYQNTVRIFSLPSKEETV